MLSEGNLACLLQLLGLKEKESKGQYVERGKEKQSEFRKGD